MEKILSRAEVPVEQTWDLTPLFATVEDFDAAVTEAEEKSAAFAQTYKDRIVTSEHVTGALQDMAQLEDLLDRVYNYVMLQVEADTSDKELAKRQAKTLSRMAKIGEETAFFENALAALEPEVLEEAKAAEPGFARYLSQILKKKEHMLSAETEAALAALAPTIDAPYQIYNDIKFGDTVFPSFEVGGKTYEMTYTAFENRYESDPSREVRHKSAEAFYGELARHKHGTASAYNAHLQREKIEATLRGYDSVFDFLLDKQDVSRELYNRQIDVITEKLAPIMRRYARLLQKIHGLDRMTTYDLKMELDPDFVSHISYEEAAAYIQDGLSVLGDDYVSIMKRAFDERWIDYAENRGKRNGAFCSGIFSVHPYILTSFNHKIDEVATLAHELGHAGQDILTSRAQTIYDREMSMYMVEAPSTTNELLMENYLLRRAGDDLRERRWVVSQMISKTYYHNFVTHLLEAAYQREVYEIIDAGGSVDADTLSDIYRGVLTRFWGDDVEVMDGTTLIWMRQPHYYMGLYPYTYSASLTVGTQMALRFLSLSGDDTGAARADAPVSDLDRGDTTPAADALSAEDRAAARGERSAADRAAARDALTRQWLDFLAAGGSKPPVELAAMVGVDVTTDQPLNEAIAYIGHLVDEVADLTEKLRE